MGKFYANFKSLHVDNVRMFHKPFDLPLEGLGLVSVVGRNRDANGSNGAGKSTIFDILRAVHLGASADGSRDIDFLLNDGASSMGYEASYGPDDYEIRKHRGDKTYGNNTVVLRNGESVGYKKDTTATKKAVYTEYVRIPEAVWDNCVVLRTDKAHTLIKGTPTERVDFLSDLCSLNCYDEVHDVLKERLAKVADKIDALRESEALLADVSAQLSGQKSEEELDAEYRLKNDELSDVRAYLKDKKELESALREAQSDCKRLMGMYDELSGSKFDGKDMDKELEELEDASRKLDAKYEKVLSAIKQVESYEHLKANPIGKKGDVKKLEKVVDKLLQEKERLDEVSRKKAEADAKLENLEDQLESVRRILNSATAQLDTAESRRDAAKDKIAAAEARIEKYSSQVRTRKEIDAEAAELSEKKTRLGILKNLVGHEFCSCPVCGSNVSSESLGLDKDKLDRDLRKVAERMDELDGERELISKVKSLKADIDALEGELAEREGVVKEAKSAVKKAKADVAEAEAAVSSWKSEIDELEDVTDEVRSVKQKISEARADLDDAKKYDDYHERLEELRESVSGDISELNEEKEALEEKKRSLSDERLEAKDYVSRLKEMNKLSRSLDVDASSAETEYDRITAKLGKVAKNITERSQMLEDLSAETGRLSEALRSVRKLLERRKKLEDDLAGLPALRRDKDFLTNLVYAYSSNGLKAKKISAVLEALKVRLKEYTAVLFSERDVDFEVKGDNSKFSIMCVRRDVDGNEVMSYDVRSLSGGEKARFVLAVVFALDDITSPAMKVNLKVLDEIDAKLDSIGKRVLLERFIPLLREKTSTLFIVSHDAEVRDASIYDKHLVVTKENMESSVELVDEDTYARMVAKERARSVGVKESKND